MNRCLPDASTEQRLIAEIEASTPRPHHANLLAAVARVIPDCTCRFALTRGGWYRAGGLIRPDGERLADALDGWLAQELDACGDDLDEFLARHHGDQLLVTRHSGRSHYFVVPYGPEPAEFLQLEVEEMQEVLDRRLWNTAAPPSDAQELSDPIRPHPVPAQAVGAPYYRFRRFSDIRQVIARLPAAIGEPHPLVRFMQEWRASRADHSAHFSAHWIIALRDYHDRYNNVMLGASPVSRHVRKLKSFHWNDALRGVEAARQLQAFDRAAGFSGAWYFHLVTSGLTPRNIAFAALQDIEAGFGYLSDMNAALLFGWLRKPYSL